MKDSNSESRKYLHIFLSILDLQFPLLFEGQLCRFARMLSPFIMINAFNE